MITGSNTIYTLDDLVTPKNIGDLARDDIKNLFVLSSTPEKMTVGVIQRVVPLGMTKTLKLVLDDNSVIGAAANQVFLTLDNKEVLLSGLMPGTSLMPLYLSRDKHDYPLYRENSSYNLEGLTTIDKRKSRKVARMVAEFKLKERLGAGTFVSYADGNRYNCHPNNIEIELKGEQNRKIVQPYIRALKEAHEFIEQTKKILKFKKNHKVVQILPGEEEQVYGIVSDTSKYVAVSGVFMKTVDCE